MLITGARKGIGRFLVGHYLEQGYRVLGCSRSEFENPPVGYEHYLADVADEAAIRKTMTAIRKKYGRLDVLINNAGIAAMNHVLLTPMATIRKILETNTVGVFLVCREATKLMIRNKWGRIVNFSTVAVPLKLDGEAAYVASKAAVEALTQVLSRELADKGITVNAIGPTPIDTDLILSVPKNKIDKLVHRQAIRRLGTPDDVANVIDFFIRDESSFVTGQTVYLGGV